jgi:hypothetical protein
MFPSAWALHAHWCWRHCFRVSTNWDWVSWDQLTNVQNFYTGKHVEEDWRWQNYKRSLFVSVYVDFPTDSTPIQISIRVDPSVSANRIWNIKLTQIDCTSPERGWNLSVETQICYYFEMISCRTLCGCATWSGLINSILLESETLSLPTQIPSSWLCWSV